MNRKTDERHRLRDTFDRAADLYHRARPDYPDDLYEDVLQATRIQHGDRLLEVGCATGKATLPLAERGLRITCLEPGRQLAAAARRNLIRFDVEVIEQRFEEWMSTDDQRFRLVYAATAWHWVDPEVRYEKAWEALLPGGYLAFWNALHVFPDGGDPFFREIQDVYDEIGEGHDPGTTWPRPGELSCKAAEIEASGRFEVVHVRQFDWEMIYDADTYIDLLNTFSGHIAMAEWKRQRLYGEIRLRLASRPDQSLRRHWGGVLHVARRVG